MVDTTFWDRSHQRTDVKRRRCPARYERRFTRDGYSIVRLRVFNFPRFVLLSSRRCFEPFVGLVALRFLRGIATL